MELNDLSDELKAKARACKTPEEVLALAKEEGHELSEGDLEPISGGWEICDDYKHGLCNKCDCKSYWRN